MGAHHPSEGRLIGDGQGGVAQFMGAYNQFFGV
jgi:hypothetical protein